VIITSLNSSKIVGIAAFGPDGIADGATPGSLIIDMSSIDPEETRNLAAQAKERNLGWVGELTLMLGGEADDVARAKTVLTHVAKNMTHMGGAGAGQTTKLINQVLCGLGFLGIAEATRLALDAGVDAGKIPEALAGGRADSALLQEYMPRFATKDYRRTGRIDNMVKDLNMVNDLARSTGTSMRRRRSGGSDGVLRRRENRHALLIHATPSRIM